MARASSLVASATSQGEMGLKIDDAARQTANLPVVGFVILSHGGQAQLQRLVRALDYQYGMPPIACHHDFGQAPLDTTAFGKNVAFVQPHVPTSWARFSVVQAELAALRLLFDKSPDWFVLLSASDYPIMAGSKVRRVLAEAVCDAFLDARSVGAAKPACSTKGAQNPKLDHFNSVENGSIKRLFYTSVEIWIPIIRFKPKLRLGRWTYRPGWKVRNIYDDWPFFFGDHWFCGNVKTAKLLLLPTAKHLALRRHLRARTHADETYFHTVIMNEPSLRVCRDNKRFAQWNGGGAHPIVLGEIQLDEMLSSGAFFARKFQHGSDVLDKIDDALEFSLTNR